MMRRACLFSKNEFVWYDRRYWYMIKNAEGKPIKLARVISGRRLELFQCEPQVDLDGVDRSVAYKVAKKNRVDVSMRGKIAPPVKRPMSKDFEWIEDDTCEKSVQLYSFGKGPDTESTRMSSIVIPVHLLLETDCVFRECVVKATGEKVTSITPQGVGLDSDEVEVTAEVIMNPYIAIIRRIQDLIQKKEVSRPPFGPDEMIMCVNCACAYEGLHRLISSGPYLVADIIVQKCNAVSFHDCSCGLTVWMRMLAVTMFITRGI